MPRHLASIGVLILAMLGGGACSADQTLESCVAESRITPRPEAAEQLRAEIEHLESIGSAVTALLAPLRKRAEALSELGAFDQSGELLLRSIAIREQEQLTADAGYAELLQLLGVAQRAGGRPAEAVESYARCSAAADRILGPGSAISGRCLNFLGVAYDDLGRYAEEEPLLLQALAIQENALGLDHPNVGFTLNNLAVMYTRLGKHARAEAFFKRSLAVFEKARGPCHENVAMLLTNLGWFYRESGHPADGLALAERGLQMRELLHGPEDYLTAFSLNNSGLTLALLGQHDQGEAYVRRALAIRERLFGTDHKDTLVSLWNLFLVRQLAGRIGESGELIGRALPTATLQGNPELRWRFQSAYRMYLQARGMASAAAYFGKEAVNTIQSMRSGISRLDRELQQSFLWDKTALYRDLADLLIGGGRLAEAQQVLAMLKEEEFFDFIRRDGKDDPRNTRPTFTGAEQPWSKRQAEIGSRLASLGARRDEIVRKQKAGLSAAEESELRQIGAELGAARESFVLFLDELLNDMNQLDDKRRAQVETRQRDVERVEQYQDDLRALGPGVVLLHYVALPDKVLVILSTAEAQTGYASVIEQGVLNRKIQSFREALQSPRDDPRALGQELFKALLGPLAADLKQMQAQTLILSLDGALRYVPFAALHDGEHYLVENYRITMVTQAADVRLAVAPSGTPGKFAGLGLTQQVPGFEPLPAVREELEAILKTGPLRGEIHLDQEFTAERMKQLLADRVAYLHVASHFVFKPGTETDSFLLLGDQSRLSLRDLRVSGFNFRGVELLTLSACETAAGGGADANGREVEGLGVMAQQRGAKSVLATLWPVADSSTAILMQNFYRLRGGAAKTSKAEALRQAQLALLGGQHGEPAQPPGAAEKQRGATRTKGANDAPRFVPDPKAPYAHPFFWAPFILMGNWL